MKKILFCIPNLMDGGAEKVLVNLVNNLDTEKYQISIFTIIDFGVNKKFLNSNIRYQYLFSRYFRGNSIVLKLFSPSFIYKKFIKEEYDIVIAYLEGSAARVISGCSFINSKKIAWIHTELTSVKALISGFRTLTESLSCYNKYDMIVCVSQSVKSAFLNITKLSVPTQVLYNTNETEIIKQKSVEQVDDLEFDSNIFKICTVGKIIESKGIDRLARIHKKLIDEGIENRIYVLGKGKEQKKIELFLKDNGLSKTFIFVGYKDNPYKYVSKCDLYVCASKKEGFSTAVTEAMIIGIPVITTNCAGMKEILGEKNEYGLIVPNDESSLYYGMKELIKNHDILEHYKFQANIRGCQFSKDKTIAEVENLLDNI
ncbi:glycosyltransferase [Anaerocolumna chitinilytica]|uniref:Glycosyl transferase n=1 Tax=Anaerocolumna chitinilytica TaxID=1727145 RepID=A0A7I8DQX1_9FIRM|nr:glycosyltransferase [Anaerocolumna chitinilytica]BCK00819.1 glycosyl transferase [Anaerocolumna chitinilytica]